MINSKIIKKYPTKESFSYHLTIAMLKEKKINCRLLTLKRKSCFQENKFNICKVKQRVCITLNPLSLMGKKNSKSSLILRIFKQEHNIQMMMMTLQKLM
jgi:hypothetical protein